MWRHWLRVLGDGHTLVRYDERGCGLSDREVGDLSVDTWVADLETRGRRRGPRPLRAARHLAGRGDRARVRRPSTPSASRTSSSTAASRAAAGCGGREERLLHEALISAIRAGWADPNPTFRHVFSMLFLPHGTPEQMAWYDELQRRSTSAATAVRLYDARGGIDVVELRAAGGREDAGRARARRPRRAGRGGPAARRPHPRRAAGGPGLGEPHPALRRAGVAGLPVGAARASSAARTPAPRAGDDDLSPRELEVLECVAAGLTNAAIAERLCLSVRTVERHLSNVYAKLRVSGKAGRAAAAARLLADAASRPPPRRADPALVLRVGRHPAPGGWVMAPMPARVDASYRRARRSEEARRARCRSRSPRAAEAGAPIATHDVRGWRRAPAARAGVGRPARARRSSSSTAGRRASSAGPGRSPAGSPRTSAS